MNKQEFLERLANRLRNLPQRDLDGHLAFYAEMIDDRIDEGLSEADAVAAIGSPHDIASQIITDLPLRVLVKESVKPKRRLSAVEITLLILGSPVWLSSAIAAAAVVLSVYALLWAAVVSLWSAFGAIVGCAFGGLAGGAVLSVCSDPFSGLALITCGLICAGLSILLFYGCKAATQGTLWLTKAMLKGTKTLFIRKEAAQ